MTTPSLDSVTGLPELDEGLFWRVSPQSSVTDELWTTFQIEIVRHRKVRSFFRWVNRYERLFWNNVYVPTRRLNSSLPIEAIRVRGYHNLTNEAILASAKYLLQSENVEMKQIEAIPTGKAKIGLYPPLSVRSQDDTA